MDEASLEKTLGRIEQAIARIEQSAIRAVDADDGLQTRHDQLREAVSQSLRQLDELLSGLPV